MVADLLGAMHTPAILDSDRTPVFLSFVLFSLGGWRSAVALAVTIPLAIYIFIYPSVAASPKSSHVMPRHGLILGQI